MEADAVKVLHNFKAHDLEILSVTVYTDRAEVKRNMKMDLEAGMNEVIIENIPRTANEDSIIVNGRGDAIIHEVQVKSDVPVLPDESSSPRLQELKNELKKLEEERRAIDNRKKVIEKRQQLLDSIVEKGGKTLMKPKDGEDGHSVALEEIAKLIDYHVQEHTKTLEKLHQVEEELRVVDEKIAKVQDEINQTELDSTHIKNIHIILESKNGGSVELDASYQVHNASWYPNYEIRVESAANTFKLTYFGNIRQNTGEDWTNVPLILSTAQPSFGGMAPRLGTLNAEFYRPPPAHPPQPRMMKAGPYGMSNAMALRSHHVDMEGVEEVAMLGAAPEFSHAPVGVAESGMTTIFMISRRASIPSDSAEHKVIIGTVNLSPKMFYETVPSKSTSVYLTAYVVNESSMPFLPGQASVYVDNSFIAKNYMKAVSPGERFKCSLGVDPAIKVEYKPVHKYSEQAGIIAKSMTTMNEQKILIRNTRSSAVLIMIREHLPKSTDEKIKIKLLVPEQLDSKDANARNATAEPAVGIRLDANHNLEWVRLIEPNKEEELTLKWSVEHPAGENVTFHEVFSHGNLD